MRVAIDDQIFTTQRFGGVSRYFVELIREFAESPALGIDVDLPFTYSVNEHLRMYAPNRFSASPLPARLRRARVDQALNTLRRRRGSTRDAVVHHTYYFEHALRMPARARVCTVYDMTPEVMPELFPHGSPHAAKELFVNACDAVCCISESTKTDLIKYYGALDKPVIVTPLGVRAAFFDAVAADGGPPFVLFVGGRFTYKNFDVVLRAMARLLPGAAPLLRCVGGAPFDDVEQARIDELGLHDVVRHEDVGDDELPALYAAAACLVFPSRYEGFGLPTVEAFAAGCPVVLAEMPCSVEIGGAAAQFFAPDDDERLAEIVDRLVTDPASRAGWIRDGRLRATEFTWQRTASATAAVYRELGPVAGRAGVGHG